MIYTDITKKAMRIAYDVHKEQVDKSGLPYIFHPFHLAGQMKDELSVCVALLHDVVEDSTVTFDNLATQGIPASVIDVLKLLTHDDAVPYTDYVQRIKNSGNQTAIAVKLADLRHNSDASRLDVVDEKTVARFRKYQEAIDILERQWCCESRG
jgi:(p)ppGpp synthase/HD superfamily hydrolase